MSDDFTQFGGRNTIVQRQIELADHFGWLMQRNQGGNGHDAAIPGQQLGTLPYLFQKHVLGVAYKCRYGEVRFV
ncbi:hypothetical protein D3C80_1601460 [compost metagenome]